MTKEVAATDGRGSATWLCWKTVYRGDTNPPEVVDDEALPEWVFSALRINYGITHPGHDTCVSDRLKQTRDMMH